MQVGVLLQGPNAEILLSNPKGLELLGLTEDQLLGKTSFDADWNVIHEDGTPFPGPTHPVPQAIATRQAIHEVVMGVYRPVTRDRVWLLVDAVPQLNSDGSVEQVVCTYFEITKRMRAEEALNQLNADLESRVKERTEELVKINDALRDTKEKYRLVADFTHDWEFWIDPNGNFIYCSSSCERITGYHSSAFEANPQLLTDIIHPDDLQVYWSQKARDFDAKDNANEIQYRIVRSDGTIRWIGQLNRNVFNNSGEYMGIRGSSRDITARIKLEQQLILNNKKYKLISENINDGVFICRNAGFEYVNKAMNRIFGYTGQEMSRITFTSLVLPDYKEEVEGFLTKDQPQNQSWELELECVKKDNSLVSVEILFNYVAHWKSVFGVVHDITEKKQIQHNILQAIIQTEEKERASFSKELHDGLGPLLSTIKLYLQWSQRPNSNKSHEEIMVKAEDILEDALTTVKEISNRLSPHLLLYYGLTSAIQSFIEKLGESSPIKITFQSNAVKRLGIEIEATLYRAVIECINNTIKHASARNIYIFLQDFGGRLQLLYQDDGIGFDLSEVLAARNGLGIFNLQTRIRIIRGKIIMHSKPGQGVDYQITVNLGK